MSEEKIGNSGIQVSTDVLNIMMPETAVAASGTGGKIEKLSSLLGIYFARPLVFNEHVKKMDFIFNVSNI